MDLSDPELTKKVKEENDNNALCELIDRHSGIYVNMVKKFGSKGLSYFEVGEILGEKDLNIYNAAIDFNEDKAKFSTHLANKTKYLCLSRKSQVKKDSRLINYDDVDFCQESDENSPLKNCLFGEMYDMVFKFLKKYPDKRAEYILKERYFNGKGSKLKSWDSISKKVNLSIQGCINVHDKIMKDLRKEFKKEI